MKGYFSELARHTGLRFGPPGTVATSTTSQPRAQPEAERPAAGIEVDEVTFVSPPRSPEESSTVGPAGLEPTSANAMAPVPGRNDPERPDRAPADRHAESDVDSSTIHSPSITIVESEVETLASGSAEEVFPSAPSEGNPDEPRVVISEIVSLETPTSPTSSSGELREHDSARDSLREISTSEPTRSSDLELETGALVIGEKILDQLSATAQPGDLDPIQGQLIVRNYLKEVTDWISTPATVEDETPSVDSVEPLEGSANAASDFHRPVSSPNQLREPPEQEGLSLSIGTIKIVIEEPRTVAAVAASPPAQAERTVAAPAPASIDLSRYYLTRW
jgi:hypothetical protein